ncbi:MULTISPECIES: Fic family protein [unclassified Brenneria]|nr:Fic family protein [Brenneria sp. hezel4-2-4]MEE3651268.1 Fic family protein [Brenneria sp. HEZEL_4_2_4]NPD01224.1 Fic family protein [Brenneria sp. hezel4-2-4]
MMLALYSIREMEEAKGELQSVMSEHPVFRMVDIKNIWRMLLDGKAHDDGKHQGLRFDNEPGYMAGMYRGLTQVLRNDLQRDDRVSPETMLAQLHDKAIGGVVDINSVKLLTEELKISDEPHTSSLLVSLGRETSRNDSAESDDDYSNILSFMEKGYRSQAVSFVLLKNDNLTKEGFNELKQRYTGNEPFPFMLFSSATGEDVNPQTRFGGISWISLNSLSPAILPEELHPAAYAQTQISHYRQNIGQISDEKGKLTEIARLCQTLEQAHCFTDGNARTLGFLFVNQLLLENKLSPSVIYDPNRFDGFSHQQLVAEIQKGQRLFERL